MLISDLQLDYALTDEFCRNHFLVGLLLREVGAALQEFREVYWLLIGLGLPLFILFGIGLYSLPKSRLVSKNSLSTLPTSS